MKVARASPLTRPVSVQEFFRDGFADWLAGEIFNPKPLAVWISLEKDRLTRLRNRNVKAAEVQPKRVHVCVQLFVKLRALASDMVETVNVEPTIRIVGRETRRGTPTW